MPESALVVFMIKHRHLTDAVFRERKQYLAVLDAYAPGNFRRVTRGQLTAARKKYEGSIWYKQFLSLLEIEFNYLPSTIASGSIVVRCWRIYKKHNLENHELPQTRTTV